jgi:hypothetical protein
MSYAKHLLTSIVAGWILYSIILLVCTVLQLDLSRTEHTITGSLCGFISALAVIVLKEKEKEK